MENIQEKCTVRKLKTRTFRPAPHSHFTNELFTAPAKKNLQSNLISGDAYLNAFNLNIYMSVGNKTLGSFLF